MNRTIVTVAVAFSASSLLLVDSAVKGTALLALAAVATLILRRDSAATRHLVWLLAIVAMLAAPVLSAMLPQWRVLPAWASHSPKPAVVDVSPPSIIRPGDVAVELPQAAEPVEVERPSATGVQAVAVLPDSHPAPVTPAAAPAPPMSSWNWINALPLVWAIGFTVLILRLSAARWMLWNSERRATVVELSDAGHVSQRADADEVMVSTLETCSTTRDPIMTALEAVRLQLGISRPVTLLIHPDKSIPVVWGILRCRLLLPAAARQWSEVQLRSVLLHELAHIKRRDALAKLLTQVACALHWFNPLVWFAAWRLDVERERACDDLVLASGVRPSAYAGHLLEVVTELSPARWTQTCGLAMARQSSLEGRLAAVLGKDLNRRDVSVALTGLALAIAVGIAVPIAMLRAADEKWNPPHGAHIGSNDFSALCVHDGKDASFVIVYHGDFDSTNRSSSNSKARTWTDSCTITAKQPGIALTFQRTHTSPDRLSITTAPAEGRDLSKPAPPPRKFGQKEYDLTKGRVFLLSDDGAVRQIDIQTPPITDQASAKKLAALIAALPPQDREDVALTTNLTGKLAPETIAKLKWGEPVNGLRMALAYPPALGDALLGKKPHFELVVQNVSEKEIHFLASDDAPNPRELNFRADNRTVLVLADKDTAKAEWHLQPGHCGVLRMFTKEERDDDGKTVSAGIEGDLSKIDRNHAVAEMEVVKAPEGAWTGKLVTGQTRGSADVAAAPAPMHKDARTLYEVWQRYARANGDIPGALIGELAAAVKTFIRYNQTWATVPKLNELLPRLDATRDWKRAEAIALLDEVAGIQDSPLKGAAEKATRSSIRQGEALSKKFADAPWGEAQPNGLRAAWVLEPGGAEHRIGAALRARLLVENRGQVPVMLQVPTWHQGWVKASDAKGKKVQASGLEWTTLAQLFPCRLAPGEFIQINTPGVGFGPRAGMGPWAGPRVGSNVLAKAGDELTLTHSLVPLDGSEVGVSEDDPHVSGPGWWLAHIQARLNRELPLPADAAERTQMLDRAIRELFATAPSAEETATFVADKTPDALDALAKRLAARVDVVSFSGKLPTAPAKFRVLAADANAGKQPRVVLGPGEYPLSGATAERGAVTLKIVGRPVGDRRTNDAQLLFEAVEFTGILAPDPHKLEVPDGWGTWAIVCRPGEGFFYLLHKGGVRKIDYSAPRKVTDTPANDLPAEFRDEVKRQLDIHEISEKQQAEIFKTVVGTPKLPKLPDEAYTKTGVHCQKFREEDAKRPGGELMGGVLEPSNPWDRDKEPLVLGVRTASDAQWRIGGTAKVGLVVRNRTGIIGRVHSGRDVKFSYTGRLDNGLSVVAVDGVKVDLKFLWLSSHQQVWWKLQTEDAGISARMSIVIEPDGSAAKIVLHKGMQSEATVGRLTLHESGSLRLELIPNPNPNETKYRAVKGLVLRRQPNAEEQKPAGGAILKPASEAPPKATEKEPFTAWGREIGGLQAGLGFKAGWKRAFSHGEKVRLVVRVRNVGKEEAKFDYTPEHFIENPPTVLDEKAKAVSLASGLVDTGVQIGREANLAPGKEIELAELTLEFSSRNEAGAGFLKPLTIYGTGKFQVGFEKVLGTGFIKPDPALSKLATGKLELTIQPVAPVPQEAPKPKPLAADAPKPDAAHGGLRADVKPDSRQLFNEDYAAFAVQSEKDVNFVLCYQGSLSNGIAEWSSGAKWRFNGNVYLVDRAKTAIAGKNVNKRVIAVNYTSDDPTKLFLDGKAYNLAAQPRMTSMGALEDAPGRVFLLRDEGEPFQTTRTLPLRSEQDLATIGVFAVGDCFSVGLYAENRRVQEMEGWVLAFDFQVPERRSGGHRFARLRIFSDGRVLYSPNGRVLHELKITAGEVSELLRWLAEDRKVPVVKAQPGVPRLTLEQEFDTWAGGVSFLQFRHNDQLHSMTVGSHLRKPGTGKEVANPGAAAFKPIGERLTELEKKAATAPAKAGADVGAE